MKRGIDEKGPYVLLEVRGSRYPVLWRLRCPNCGADREGLLNTAHDFASDCPACRPGPSGGEPEETADG